MANSFFRQLLCPLGFYPGKTTQASRLQELVEAMRIQPTKHELIRLGPDSDGGYLLPDDLDGLQFCFSPGVANCSDFELQLAERGFEVFLADRSVDGPSVPHPNFHFQKKFIAASNCELAGVMSLDTWYQDLVGPVSPESPEALLQMDIEGCEYEVLHSLSEALLSRFRVVIIEFHKLNQLADRFAFSFMAPAIRKLLRSHAVVHIHPNNYRRTLAIHNLEIPANMEITFLRRDRLQASKKVNAYPHPLDRRCVLAKPELALPSCWY
jgi:hypothetical protein